MSILECIPIQAIPDQDNPTNPSLKMPAHWDTPKGRVASIFFKALCIVSFGRSTLQHTWNVSEKGDKDWKEEKEALLARINNLSIVAGLLLSTMAVLLSTAPPVERFFNWMKPVPYLCILGAFPPTLGAIIVGATMGLAVTAAEPNYVQKICKSRLRVVCVLIVIAYPFFVMGCVTLVLAVGLVAAAQVTGYKLVMAGSLIALTLPILMGPVFIWVVRVSNVTSAPTSSSSDSV
ncbi:hypothetical protein BYT27DRAFT_7105890 [Phlegmacium glaucopus]|nr:hypothetical protein BYT27DRAFT_7105890 [Phlegmacium glaucopus]